MASPFQTPVRELHAPATARARSVLEARPAGRAAARPRIWAVGGGKGGVGKSVVVSNLAAAVAGTGRRCALIDADLGAANLHTLLGVPRPRRTLSSFWSGEVDSLAEVMVQTSVPDLWLVSGSQALLEMANPRHTQKEMLARHIRRLDVDEVFLDLGAGSAFTVLDLFLLAERRLVVITPEPTAIENAEHFLNAAFHRSLRAIARHSQVRAALLRLKESRRGLRVRSARELIDRVREIDASAARLLQESAESFAPVLLVNQVQGPEHRRVGPELAASCLGRLGMAVEFGGSLEVDPGVAEAVARRQPALQLFPGSRFSRHVEALARRLLRDEGEGPPGPRPPRPEGGGRLARRLVPVRGSLPPLGLAEPGAYLRRCRERLGLGLEEMTERTRIRGLDHLERERFDRLPPEPYLRGFVLEYARELGVPQIEDLVARYLERYRARGGRH